MPKTSRKSVDHEQVMKTIEKLDSTFDFGDLRAALSRPSYDQLQAVLFELLGSENPPIVQVFDADRACIRFQRVGA